MRVAIITLPLHTNYGGLLQAAALKAVLEELGQQVVVLDLEEKMKSPSGIKAPFVYLSRAFKRLLKGTNGPEVFREIRYKKELPILSVHTSKFVEKHISPRILKSYQDIKEGEFDAFVVGSDQVWRPLYFNDIEDAFLAFAKDWDVRRLSYAASFGTDALEYEYTQLEACSKLLERFDGVSVREDSAVKQCEEWFDYDGAEQVLDPVMLLPPQRYVKEITNGGGVVSYVLDPSDQKSAVADFISRVSGMNIHDISVHPYANNCSVEERIVPAVEDWLKAFAGADFVVTDSFHGCVLAILMHKRFIAVGNNYRGMARLNSLLKLFDLDMRLVHGIDPEDDGEYFLSHPDWEAVENILIKKREKSLAFLRKALNL